MEDAKLEAEQKEINFESNELELVKLKAELEKTKADKATYQESAQQLNELF